jgi:hypothetical protein
VKPPFGPQLLIVVGGKGGCGCTCRHPAVVAPIRASIATITRSATSMVWIQLSREETLIHRFNLAVGEGKGLAVATSVQTGRATPS